MISEGIELMVVGMSVVFAFLVLLVILMRVSGALLSKFPEPEVVAQPSRTAVSGDTAAKIAVALAAAHRTRK